MNTARVVKREPAWVEELVREGGWGERERRQWHVLGWRFFPDLPGWSPTRRDRRVCNTSQGSSAFDVGARPGGREVDDRPSVFTNPLADERRSGDWPLERRTVARSRRHAE
jgi:hypothetical protein